VSKAYKGGTYPTIAATTYLSDVYVKQEDVIDYEGGFKATLLGKTLQINAAGFYYDYSNKQVLGTIDIPVIGFVPALVNVPKSRVVGGELQATYMPVSGLTLGIEATYAASRITDKLSGFIGTWLRYQSASNAALGEEPLASLNSYTTVDAQAGLETDKWRFSLWGRNITNRYYWNNVFLPLDSIARYAAPPVTYGMAASYRF
jgi:iron complex outermembrane receptor protein